jgi:hypothetical protein
MWLGYSHVQRVQNGSKQKKKKKKKKKITEQILIKFRIEGIRDPG